MQQVEQDDKPSEDWERELDIAVAIGEGVDNSKAPSSPVLENWQQDEDFGKESIQQAAEEALYHKRERLPVPEKLIKNYQTVNCLFKARIRVAVIKNIWGREQWEWHEHERKIGDWEPHLIHELLKENIDPESPLSFNNYS